MATITYNNKSYPVRLITLLHVGDVLVGNMSLLEELTDEHGDLASYEAEHVDEMIYFYVEDDELNLSRIDLAQLITERTTNH